MIGIEREAGLLRLTLRRPDKANSLTKAMLESLVAALDDVPQALVLTGEGKVFSAGADLEGMAQGLGHAPEWEVLSARIAALSLSARFDQLR